MFTKNTLRNFAWTRKGENLELENPRPWLKPITVIVGITEEEGLEAFIIRKKPVKSQDFVQFLHVLRNQNASHRLVVFCDNARVHHSRQVGAACRRLNMELLFNVPYAPELNGIEIFWSLRKRLFKKKLLEVLLARGGPRCDMHRIIPESVQGVSCGAPRQQTARG